MDTALREHIFDVLTDQCSSCRNGFFAGKSAVFEKPVPRIKYRDHLIA